MTKHEQYYSEMLAKHHDLFNRFQTIHQQYLLEPDKFKAQFDETGAEVLDMITDYENRLCAHSEKGKYGVYSDKLAEKFWALVRVDFPKIDDVGIEITYEPLRVHPEPSRRAKPLPPKPKPRISSQSPDDFADAAINEVLASLKKTRL